MRSGWWERASGHYHCMSRSAEGQIPQSVHKNQLCIQYDQLCKAIYYVKYAPMSRSNIVEGQIP